MEGTEAQPTQGVESDSGTLAQDFVRAAGVPEDDVQVDITYDLIRQFSHQLYTNPRKAIEELGCNSYDAGASECYVRTPTTGSEDLIVLDNGVSMDLKGIQDLWKVGISPKTENPDGYRLANRRSQIGKFGVGKLAAFALGKTLTHVAVTGGWARIVRVGEDEIRGFTGGEKPKFKVYKLAESKAREILDRHLFDLPRPWKKHWKSWTLAIVSDIDLETQRQALAKGFLVRMLTHALPLSAQFCVILDGTQVPEREIPPADVLVRVAVTDPTYIRHLQNTLTAFWRQRLGLDDQTEVPPDLIKVGLTSVLDPMRTTRKLDAIDVPHLGPVAGGAIMTKTTLTKSTVAERGYRDHGFKIYVHGKLANPEDELFGITQRSLKYWYRFRAEVEIPRLDKVLLVQRNSFSEKSELTYVAREVLRALFGAAKARYVDEEDEEGPEYEPEPFGTRLRYLAPLSGQIALRGLAAEGQPAGNLDRMEVGFAPDGEDRPVAKYQTQDNTITINEDHPLIAALEEVQGAKAAQVRQVVGEVAAGSVITSGYLKARGIDQDIIDEAAGLMDDSFRTAAGYIRDPVEDLIGEINETSESGGTPFENAVVRALRSLRLSAARRGGPELPDGVVEIPLAGAPNLRVAIEAKGSKHPITHEEINPSALKEHEAKLDCSRTIIVAREFQVRGRGDEDSVLLRITRESQMPLLTTSAVATILRYHRQRPFTHTKLVEILTTWRHPSELEAWIKELWASLPELGILRLILEIAWDAQAKDVTNRPDPGMILGDERIRKRKLSRTKLTGILEAVQTTTGLLSIVNPSTYEFELLQDPETIIEAMTKSQQEKSSGPEPSGATPRAPPKA
ncbi:MAG TPA: ATP-binding protein [Thermoplasmata archaeon]|nr:ATP-binding protein [Thermoplasmata archaeon]